jgi:ABC-type transport system substrate-binding protein
LINTTQWRRGVTFHDGTPWDAQACKANFDQVFDQGLINYHGWYDLPKRIKSWEVSAGRDR